ncbi:MAG: hypothetical protein RBU27_12405 [Bacteroidota bacterium]|nr:hypothetical protein [Bacteroidota bacterium]
MKPAAPKAFAKERGLFKALLLTNPNYFGNLVGSQYKPVLPITGNTHYEELACLGYHPQQRSLEAVVYVHQSGGYGTDVCGAGTPEFVRFYLSYDGGATWDDQGMTSFQAFNIPAAGPARLEYAVSLPVKPKARLCKVNPLIRARAILSWNDPPPAGQPNWTPVWGNVRNAVILVEPLRHIPWKDLFEFETLKFPPWLPEVVDLETPLVSMQKSLGSAELASLYKGQDVPVHRFAFKEISSALHAKSLLHASEFTTLAPGVAITPDILDLLFPKTDGNISYEELTCIGLDPNTPDTLVGIITVKKSAGYSGGPCTDGSREYVTFWADFDGNGSFETCLGTADVRVYDLPELPAGGVQYAVRLPVDLAQYRESCRKGAKVVRIRAILSWNVPVSCAAPNTVPVWGNREETLIHIAPVAQAPAGRIAILGGIPVSFIDDLTGMTTADAVFATNNLPPDAMGRPCAFGHRITVQGAPLPGHRYKVEVTPLDAAGNPVGAPAPLVTNLTLTRFDGTTHVLSADPVTHRFPYQPFTQNVNSLLAQWDSAGDEKWQVKLSTFDAGGTLVGEDTHVIQLDNTWPTVAITITTGTGHCGKFTEGTLLQGDVVATDKNLARYALTVEPAINTPPVGVPAPSGGTINTATAPGDTWSLDTTGMKPCGYLIRVVAVDRVIVNSQSVGHHASASAGFCLEAKGKK